MTTAHCQSPVESYLGSHTFSDLILRVSPRTATSEHQEDRPQRVLRIGRKRCVIGSAADSTITIRSASIAERHCQLCRLPAGVYLRALSGETRVNGQAVHERWLQDDDEIEIGDITIQVVDLGKWGWTWEGTDQLSSRRRLSPYAPRFTDGAAQQAGATRTRGSKRTGSKKLRQAAKSPSRRPRSARPSQRDKRPVDNADSSFSSEGAGTQQLMPTTEAVDRLLDVLARLDEKIDRLSVPTTKAAAAPRPAPTVDLRGEHAPCHLGFPAAHNPDALDTFETPPEEDDQWTVHNAPDIGQPGNWSVEYSRTQPEVEPQQSEWRDASEPVYFEGTEGWFQAAQSSEQMEAAQPPSHEHHPFDPMHAWATEAAGLSAAEDPWATAPAESRDEPQTSGFRQAEGVDEACSLSEDERRAQWLANLYENSTREFPETASAQSAEPGRFAVLDQFAVPGTLEHSPLDPTRGDHPNFEATESSESGQAASAQIDESVNQPIAEDDITPSSTSSVEDLLRQMRQSFEEEADRPTTQLAGAVAAEPMSPIIGAPMHDTSSQAALPQGEQAPGGEGAIDDYMHQLLNRLKTGTPITSPSGWTNVPSAAQTSLQTQSESAARPGGSAAQSQSELHLPQIEPLTAEKFVPMRTAPEQQSHLSTLRQLANQSVRSAIQVAHRRRRINDGLIYLVGGGVTFCLAGVFFALAQSLFDLTGIFALVFVALSAYCCFKYLCSRWPDLPRNRSDSEAVASENTPAKKTETKTEAKSNQ